MNNVSITFAITPEQRKVLRDDIRAYEDKHNKSISVSEYIRRTLFPPVSIPLPPTEKPTDPVNNGKYSFDLDDM